MIQPEQLGNGFKSWLDFSVDVRLFLVPPCTKVCSEPTKECVVIKWHHHRYNTAVTGKPCVLYEFPTDQLTRDFHIPLRKTLFKLYQRNMMRQAFVNNLRIWPMYKFKVHHTELLINYELLYSLHNTARYINRNKVSSKLSCKERHTA